MRGSLGGISSAVTPRSGVAEKYDCRIPSLMSSAAERILTSAAVGGGCRERRREAVLTSFRDGRRVDRLLKVWFCWDLEVRMVCSVSSVVVVDMVDVCFLVGMY